MHAHLTASICVDDLVQAVGVSRRTLHAGFRNFRQTTPGAQLKRMRLEAARSALLDARETGRTSRTSRHVLAFFIWESLHVISGRDSVKAPPKSSNLADGDTALFLLHLRDSGCALVPIAAGAGLLRWSG